MIGSMIGSTLGPYRITGLLGEGGMGAVYRATDNIEREVAIKALLAQLTGDESRLQRFRAEAVALGRLHHPNIASLYHLLEQDGNYYMVMEFVEGQTLEDIVRNKGAMTPEMALTVFDDGLKGFEHAHARGVIHRDIKPSNLMVSSEGTTKITDFGIARMAGTGRMTQAGRVIGTLEYMSPEQVRGLEQDARSDIYSLGILLFELLTGRMPFTATSDYEIMRAHLEEVPPPARSVVATLPAGLDTIIAKALAKDPAARFQNVGEMRREIEAVQRELPTPPPPQTLLVAPEIVPSATRQVELPNAFPETGQAQPVVDPYPNGNVNGNGNGNLQGAGNVPRPRPAPTPMPKWAIPAAASLMAVVLVGGLLAFSASRKGTEEVVPTPAPTEQVATENTVVPDNGPNPFDSGATNTATNGSPQNGSISPQDVPVVKATSAPQVPPDIKIPDSIPGFTDPTAAPVLPTAAPAPTRVPVAVAPTAVPAPRQHERVASPPRPRVRPRVVERPRPKPRVRIVERSRPRRVVERPRPRPRVVSRPAPRRHSSGGGEEAALRALIKGG
ncbi:serine/threonine-protein kinase PrkC [Abditibacteriota bacterium]|nr:serine/threonine-protein kinase PrkC [Abditibacteriota bacterium]